jgi:tRNA (cytidine/uridine-2'-O-)-methyltransferase
MNMHIVLVEPEIPQNTGNIARSAVLTGTALHLVQPLGFSLADRYLKRAGLDYWPEVDLRVWDDFAAAEQALAGHGFWFATTRTERRYDTVRYQPDDVLVFGKETAGLPRELLERRAGRTVRIPMRPLGRPLNLANAVNIILFEALRQQDFASLTAAKTAGPSGIKNGRAGRDETLTP